MPPRRSAWARTSPASPTPSWRRRRKAKSRCAACSTASPGSCGLRCSAPAPRTSTPCMPTHPRKSNDICVPPPPRAGEGRVGALKTKTFASRTDRLQAMNQALDRELSRLSQRVGSSQSSLLTEMVQYHLGLRKAGERPGKRLRANLALLTCEAFGKRYADAMWAAVAVELAHNFSLVFDDVQDHDELRRGRPTVWKVWGLGQAINAGAALEALVTRAVIDLLPARYADRTRPALLLLTDSMLALCRGQVLDLQFEQRVDVSVDEYMEMVGLKTAALFTCAARLGGLAAGVGDASLDKAGKFGYHLGIAFQVIDDILGVWGSTSQTGKPVGSDLKNGKKTLPTLVALKGGAAGNRRVLRSLLTRAKFTSSEMETARPTVPPSSALAICRRQATEHLAEARLQLFGMTDRPNWAVRALAAMVTILGSGLVEP